ncbi:MAG: SCO family protein [Myxococcota bacterium]|nr:SCO family protein [Myxococcota bacterium]
MSALKTTFIAPVFACFASAAFFLVGSLGFSSSALADASGGEKDSNYTRESVSYLVPDVQLVAHDGDSVSLVSALGGEKPVMVNFVFTSCTTICPVLSASFAEVSRRLADKGDSIEFVSISIDPEYDTQEKLAEYAKRMGAGESWTFLTGNPEDIFKVEKAFNTYRGNKMNHLPLTFIKPAGAEKWVRLEGFPSVDEVLAEYKSAKSS